MKKMELRPPSPQLTNSIGEYSTASIIQNEPLNSSSSSPSNISLAKFNNSLMMEEGRSRSSSLKNLKAPPTQALPSGIEYSGLINSSERKIGSFKLDMDKLDEMLELESDLKPEITLLKSPKVVLLKSHSSRMLDSNHVEVKKSRLRSTSLTISPPKQTTPELTSPPDSPPSASSLPGQSPEMMFADLVQDLVELQQVVQEVGLTNHSNHSNHVEESISDTSNEQIFPLISQSPKKLTLSMLTIPRFPKREIIRKDIEWLKTSISELYDYCYQFYQTKGDELLRLENSISKFLHTIASVKYAQKTLGDMVCIDN